MSKNKNSLEQLKELQERKISGVQHNIWANDRIKKREREMKGNYADF